MTVRKFRRVFLALLGLILCLSTVWPEEIAFGASIEWVNGEYAFSAGARPWSIGLAAVILVAFVVFMQARGVESARPLPGLLRRFGAFWLDFVLALFALGPLLGIVPMVVEWRRTGVFTWYFARNTQAAGDVSVALLLTSLLIIGLLFYFTIPLVLRRPSPGACVAGYQVVADVGYSLSLRRALLRNLVGYIALCSAWIAPFVGRNQQDGKFWLDKVFHTRAVHLD